jgi:zinc D-Ala-D-Ala carboxypeptidase
MPPTQQLDQQLSPHFWLSEFTHSQAATRQGISNAPNVFQVANLERTAALLELVRDALGGVPIIISSGFRSQAVNRAVGGATNPPSAHLDGCAADFTAPGFGSPRAICQRLVALPAVMAGVDQLIYEGTWVHIGIAPKSSAPRGEVLTAIFAPGQRTRYAKGLVL